jgi:hypothetical protein
MMRNARVHASRCAGKPIKYNITLSTTPSPISLPLASSEYAKTQNTISY